MRRPVRAASVTLAGLLGVPALASTALAAPVEAPVGVTQTGWFWQRVAPAQAGEPSHVPAGDLAVAADTSGAPTKATYVQLDLGSLPDRAAMTALAVTLTLDPAAQQVMAAAPELRACRPTGPWVPGSGSDWAARPADDCSVTVRATYDAAAKAYRFDLLPFAAGWARGDNRGFVVLPPVAASAPAAPFQLAFLGTPGVTAAYEPAAAPVVPAPVPAPTAAPVPQPQPVAGGPGLGSVEVPVPAAPRPTAAPRPSVAPPSRRTVVRARALVPATDGAPSAGFLLALLAGGTVLAGTAVLVAEDSLSPATAIARRRALRLHG